MTTTRVSVLFSEPKIPQSECVYYDEMEARVSVLFSEPKIPQFRRKFSRRWRSSCFSALQRAENSSIELEDDFRISRAKFQCSSASRKFLNARSEPPTSRACEFQCSSASRKFLNSSLVTRTARAPSAFQCSSASRKFLNRPCSRCNQSRK